MRRFFIIIILFSVVFPLTGCNLAQIFGTSPNQDTTTTIENDTPDEQAAPEEITVDESPEASVNQQAFRYVDYTPELFEELKGKQPVALSFHADWCPTCRSLEKNIKKNLSSLPDNSTILVVDYDNSQALKKEFGITVQTTLVFFDADGKQKDKVYNPSISKIRELLSS